MSPSLLLLEGQKERKKEYSNQAPKSELEVPIFRVNANDADATEAEHEESMRARSAAMTLAMDIMEVACWASTAVF